MSNRVFVTGIGIISAIGNGVEETVTALEQSRSGLGTISYLDTEHKGTIPFCEVKYSNETLRQMAGVTNRNISRTALLGLIAAKGAWE
ncbi:beta-ketoacyl-[acyl-carrier-protein] synthase family protein, partial [bacterium]|nr:beta-ketoacyl-[acyl-carrier-protein] synthase family protein [bacterium]